MKNIIFITACSAFIGTAAMTNTGQRIITGKDTIREQKKPPQPHVVKGRRARMRLQQQQIKKHEKEWKRVDSAQNKLDKELHKSNTDSV